MSLKEQIEADLKTAMLAGDKTLVTTLRGLKSAILNVEITEGKRDSGLDDESIVNLLTKEAKKRQESADMYKQGNSAEREAAELEEKAVIEKYLPKQMSDGDLEILVDRVIAEQGELTPQMMGQVIGAVKQQSKGLADGGRIALLVKARLDKS